MEQTINRAKKSYAFRIGCLEISRQMVLTCCGLAVYILVTRLMFDRCCPFQIFCGLPCPGCGLLHAGVQLLMLQFTAAWQTNPCIYLWAMLGILYFCHLVFGRFSGKILFGLMTAVCLMTMAVYCIRMQTLFPAYPMDYFSDNILFLLSRL